LEKDRAEHPVILEHAILDVSPPETVDYEAALKQALPLIAATTGFIRLEVRPCLEKPGRYLLLVEWRELTDHTVGFRNSDRYQAWKNLLHRFYSPFPLVEHYGEPAVTG
jgi:heme-degrading monooxygenase HmoA